MAIAKEAEDLLSRLAKAEATVKAAESLSAFNEGERAAAAIVEEKEKQAAAIPLTTPRDISAFEERSLRKAMTECRCIFMAYENQAVERLAEEFHSIHPSLLQMLPEMVKRFETQRASIATNGQFLRAMVGSTADLPKSVEASVLDACIPYVHGVLTQLRREWCEEGKAERQASFAPILEAFERALPKGSSIIVPGAGLGRLNWELSQRGYEAAGVERAMSMLIVGEHVLNTLLPKGQTVQFCPHAHEARGPCNVRYGSHLGRTLTAPDKEAMEAMKTATATATKARVIAGDFETLSVRPEHRGGWDGVAMCFYVDACGDAIAAAKAARVALRDGGILVCCGPLEYDGTNGAHSDERTLRLCGDELLLLLERMGFDILESRDVPCEYESDTLSMLRMKFDCLFIVARKRVVKKTTMEAPSPAEQKADEEVEAANTAAADVE